MWRVAGWRIFQKSLTLLWRIFQRPTNKILISRSGRTYTNRLSQFPRPFYPITMSKSERRGPVQPYQHFLTGGIFEALKSTPDRTYINRLSQSLLIVMGAAQGSLWHDAGFAGLLSRHNHFSDSRYSKS